MGLAATVASAGQPDGDSKSSRPGLLSGLFGDKSKAKAGADKAVLVEEKPSSTSTVETLAAEQQRQLNAILRRMEVCDRLRKVAYQTDNEELLRQVDELEARATELYRRHTAHLPIATPVPQTPSPTLDKKQARRDAARGNAARNKDLDDFPPPLPRRPASGLDRLGGDFESRESGILNGTSMGRDKP